MNNNDNTNKVPVLELDNLHVQYKSEGVIVKAVNGVSLKLGKQETIGLVGETGAGKTTTALAILQLLPEATGSITQGDVRYEGESLLNKSNTELRAIRGGLISMIFQDPMTALNPIKTVGDQILETLVIHNYDNKDKSQLDDKVDEILNW